MEEKEKLNCPWSYGTVRRAIGHNWKEYRLCPYRRCPYAKGDALDRWFDKNFVCDAIQWDGVVP